MVGDSEVSSPAGDLDGLAPGETRQREAIAVDWGVEIFLIQSDATSAYRLTHEVSFFGVHGKYLKAS